MIVVQGQQPDNLKGSAKAISLHVDVVLSEAKMAPAHSKILMRTIRHRLAEAREDGMRLAPALFWPLTIAAA
jgi:hypothetical protein